MASVTIDLIERADVLRGDATAAASADGQTTLSEAVVLRYALSFAAPRATPYQQRCMIGYIDQYAEFLAQQRWNRLRPAPVDYDVDPATAKFLRALDERLRAQRHGSVPLGRDPVEFG